MQQLNKFSIIQTKERNGIFSSKRVSLLTHLNKRNKLLYLIRSNYFFNGDPVQQVSSQKHLDLILDTYLTSEGKDLNLFKIDDGFENFASFNNIAEDQSSNYLFDLIRMN